MKHKTILKSEIVNSIAKDYKEKHLYGRWITVTEIEKFILKFTDSKKISTERIGKSEENRNIHQLTIGSGPIKILIWTQMHGNESTGTKAVIDLLNYLYLSQDQIATQILSKCTIKIIPILNPDGAEYYTRENAYKVDLNRDAVDRKAIESQLLRRVLEEFSPDFCFNLHDQRTVFGVKGTKNPATISFLAPSEDVTRKVTPARKRTMNIIIAMNSLLQQIIPNHVGRYTDVFYPTATGDNFQKLGFSTILIESGHYKDDYQRERVREFTFISILQGIYHISLANKYEDFNEYFEIPNNKENFRDLLHIHSEKPNEAFQFDEVLEKPNVKFIPKQVFGDISELFFHKEIDFVR